MARIKKIRFEPPSEAFYISCALLVPLGLLGNQANTAGYLGLHPPLVWEGHQYWRLLTSMFVHYNVVHLISNLIGLYMVEPWRVRTSTQLCVMFGGGLIANIITSLWYLIGQPELANTILIGASGAIFAGFGAGYVTDYKQQKNKAKLFSLAFLLAVIPLFDGLYASTLPEGVYVGTLTHMSGTVIGALLAWVLPVGRKQPQKQQEQSEHERTQTNRDRS